MAEFVNTIDALGDDAVVDSIITRTITEFKDDKITSVGNNAFNGCVSLSEVSLPECTHLMAGAFGGCSALEEISMPNLVTTSGAVFQGCTALKRINMPEVTNLDSDAFSGSIVETVCFPKVTRAGVRVFANNDSHLRIADFHSPVAFGGNTFYICPRLIALILRSTEAISTAATTTLFQGNYAGANGPIMKGEGYIYVPRALVESYKVATNWNTWASQFRALEDYTVDGTIMGALDETKI
jgi:hypothetical protein